MVAKIKKLSFLVKLGDEDTTHASLSRDVNYH